MLLYVDDILVASNNKTKVDKTKVAMNNKFDLKDLGVVRKILAIEIIEEYIVMIEVEALSTTETEYIAMIKAMKKALWLKGLAKELKVQNQVAIVYCDNNNAILSSKNQVYHGRTKHIDVKLHCVREETSRESMKVVKVSTDHNPSDVTMIALLGSNKFFHCLDLIQLIGD